MTDLTTWYSSVAGVVLATGLLVAILKRALGNVSYANTVPTWVYSVVVAGVLTTLTNQVWHTLPGNLWQLLMQSVGFAAVASGFYTWLNAPTKSLAAAAISVGTVVEQQNAPNRVNVAALVDLKKVEAIAVLPKP